jgi:hypothetical protein
MNATVTARIGQFPPDGSAVEVKRQAMDQVALNFADRILRVLGDRDFREDESEPIPNSSAVADAAMILARLDEQRRNDFEIEPFWGQLSLIWRSGAGKRVKATIGGDGSFSVYHERMADGRVVESELVNPQNRVGYLNERLAWL